MVYTYLMYQKKEPSLYRKTKGRLYSLEPEWSGEEIADCVRETDEWSVGERPEVRVGWWSSGQACSSVLCLLGSYFLAARGNCSTF